MDLLIEHQCPQCGAPATLTETDRLFTCEFCRVKSFLVQRGYFRYTLPDSAPAGKELVYFPYWRFKGMMFFCVPGGVRHRFADVSHCALGTAPVPVSLGFRSQALKLKFVAPDAPGRFQKPDLPLDRAMAVFEKRFSLSLPQPILHQAHVGDSVSLIYAPHYLEERLVDAVLNRPVPQSLPEGWDPAAIPGGPAGRCMDFLATLCPACGWDLQGERDSLVLACRNCRTLWKGTKKGLENLKFAHLPPGEGADYFIPFWRIQAETEGIALDTYADLLRAANLPRAPRPEWEKIGFRYWVPAFKIRPEIFLRISTHVTLSQPVKKPVRELPGGRMHPVNLPVTEALESLKITLAGFLKPRQHLPRILPDIRVRARTYSLVYIPFREGHHEMLQPEFRLSITKSHLALAGNL